MWVVTGAGGGGDGGGGVVTGGGGVVTGGGGDGGGGHEGKGAARLLLSRPAGSVLSVCCVPRVLFAFFFLFKTFLRQCLNVVQSGFELLPS